MKNEEYRLKIENLDKGKIPMAKLAEYLTDLASLLGFRESVHFSDVVDGCVEIVAEIEYQDAPKVRERLRGSRSTPGEVQTAFRRLDRKLRLDNASANLLAGEQKVVEFPGNKAPVNLQFGPFNEPGSVVGVPIRVGGKNDPVPVHLKDMDGTIYECLAKVVLAENLAKFMFRTPVRADGVGRWRREASGQWIMEKFTIKDFEPVRSETLSQSVTRLRQAAQPFADSDDPLKELHALRKGLAETNG